LDDAVVITTLLVSRWVDAPTGLMANATTAAAPNTPSFDDVVARRRGRTDVGRDVEMPMGLPS
jgi:hypothetical protein